MPNKPDPSRVLAQDGYRPLTEGYQPGSQVVRPGFAPSTARQPSPPSGGSSASKPSTATATPKK